MRRLLILLWLLLALPVAAEPLRLARNDKPAEQDVAAQLLREIALRADLQLLITPLPAARATHMIERGPLQGEVARLADYGDSHPQLLRVEPAYYQLHFAVFCRSDRAWTIQQAADLQGRSVGIIRGVPHARQLAAAAAQLVEVDDAQQLYAMLNAGRIELAIDTVLNGQYQLQLRHFPQLQLRAVLMELPMFVYLRPEQQMLGERLAAVISHLSASGELSQLTAQLERQFFAANSVVRDHP
jgi:polar amino acid transport system substrate-binding protein